MPRSPGERLVGSFYQAVTRVTGLRTELIPAHMRRQFAVVGIDDAQLTRVLGSVRRLADWPYAWEAEGDRHAAHGRARDAMVAYYVGQRLLTTETPLKRRLYGLAVDAYAASQQLAPLERFWLDVPSTASTISGYLQVPPGASSERPAPAIVLVPGVTSAKEELFPISDRMLRRGWAVARIDNPGYGETTGVVQAGTERHPALVLDHIAGDARIDTSRMHLWGASLGGLFALHSAIDSRAKSVVVVSAPFAPDNYFRGLPGSNLTALGQMTGLRDFTKLTNFCSGLTLRGTAAKIVVPTKVFHGGRDRTIPVTEGRNIVEAVSGMTSLTVWPRDHHICLEHLDELVAGALDWYVDPAQQARTWQRELSDERSGRMRQMFGDRLQSGQMVERPATSG